MYDEGLFVKDMVVVAVGVLAEDEYEDTTIGVLREDALVTAMGRESLALVCFDPPP